MFKKLEKCTFNCETLANANPTLVYRLMQISDTLEFFNSRIETRLPLGHEANVNCQSIILRDSTMGECEQNLGFTFPKKYCSKLKSL